MPAIVEADDDGLYVVKFRGAGQGPLALAAELIAGELGRALALAVPELVFIEIDPALGRNEPDEEIRDLLRASEGLNLGLDYLPGSVMFDPAARDKADPETASRGVWFDSFVMNVDRTAKNPNLLIWHKTLYFIDHGAAMYFHHNWETAVNTVESAFGAIKQHVLLPWAADIRGADSALRSRVTRQLLSEVATLVPSDWIAPATADQYVDYFLRRRGVADRFVEEAERARASLI